ncbi:inositol-trisphosphate 3-kinase, partial [Sarracenia purpurea var. burkii]
MDVGSGIAGLTRYHRESVEAQRKHVEWTGFCNDAGKIREYYRILSITHDFNARQQGRDERWGEDVGVAERWWLVANALGLAAPASDVLLRQHTSTVVAKESESINNTTTKIANQSWFQLSGHPDCFAPAGPGTIWKKCSGGTERNVYEALSQEPALKDIVPRYLREVEYAGETFIELQDLLHGFRDPHVMDIKMGTRTFLESEVQNTFAREDLYLKMIAVDPSAPTAEEHVSRAVTKLRYMQFREEQSSTSTLGFRIEAMKFRGSKPVTDLKKVKSSQEVSDTLSLFLGNREDIRQRLATRLAEIRTKLEQSHYFRTHE